MPSGKLFSDFEEKQFKKPDQDIRIEIAQDFERLKSESKAYFFFMKRISDLRDVAHYHVMLLAGEAVGAQWKAQLKAYDEVLGIPDEFFQKAREADAEKKMTSVF